ncbi:MAG TPA: argininosuccinate lyase [Deltaproteobacteria bacterium]|nr:argininosuccinate lyase [Deltaproteobacteria bacterium]HCP44961.1 argininosuccinate lyase [Deltaproteobacteria bacterium]|tara:strand:- start:526 stop:1731 length:1206 start_codon:yes stop_codon:yes gene_type:complete
MSRLWDKGQPLDSLIEAYTVGDDPTLDLRLVPYDVAGSKAHARMLASIGVLSVEELNALLSSLDDVLAAHDEGRFIITTEDEDVHTAIERFLVDSVGAAGQKIHTARSRNDQVLTALRLWQRDAVQAVREALDQAISGFMDFAAKHESVPLPGYTHLQRAMPSTVARWSLGYASLLRDNAHLLGAADAVVSSSPLGSAAGYGVPEVLPIDREGPAEELGFDSVQLPAEAAQSSRGKGEATLLFALSEIAGDLGKWAWDLCLYVTAEFGYFRLPVAFTTGSSIMPQKRNPDVLELTRARAHGVRATLSEVMAISSSLPSGYHRDLQLLKGPLFRGFDETVAMLEIAKHVMDGLVVDYAACEAGMSPELHATEEAYRMVKEGVPFREAYRQVGRSFRGGDDEG